MDEAPLGRADLERCLLPFGLSFALPGKAHTSPEVFDWEREHFFGPSWVCVGRGPGSPGSLRLGGWTFERARVGIDPEEQFGNLWDLLAPWRTENLVVVASHDYEVRANWKLIHENYQECYHCSQIHPELCRVTAPDSGYSYEMKGLFVAGPMDLLEGAETMSLDGSSKGVPIRGLTSRQLREIGYFGVFPNLLISTHPDYVLTHRLEPLAPDRTLVECEWLFPQEALDTPGFSPDYAVEFWDITNREDWAACESLQRTAASRGYEPGPMSPAWEAGVYMQVRMIAQGYLDGSVTQPPVLPSSARSRRRETLAAGPERPA